MMQASADRVKPQGGASGGAEHAIDGFNALVKDDLLLSVHSELGQYYMDKRQWRKAGQFFVRSKQGMKLTECLFRLADYASLEDLQDHPSSQADLHKTLAVGYQAAGMCSEAVTSFLKVLIPNVHSIALDNKGHVPRSKRQN